MKIEVEMLKKMKVFHERHGEFERGGNEEDNEQATKEAELSRMQVAKTSCETPETKILKILSKCFSRLKVPPARKSQREPQKFLCNLRNWSFHPRTSHQF